MFSYPETLGYIRAMQVVQLRGGLVEARHPIHVSAFQRSPDAAWPAPLAPNHPNPNAPGLRLLDIDGDTRTFWRSAAKPFQVYAALQAIEDARPDVAARLTDADLAICASSHSGSADHTARVQHLLQTFGLSPHQLQCGAEAPLDPAEVARLAETRTQPSPLHNDCSGKHALMLLACAVKGWDDTQYLSPEHPLQQGVLAAVSRFAGQPYGAAIDGCGVPTFHMSLHQMAVAWAHLAAAMATPSLDPRLARIGHAMAAFPALTSGVGRLDLALANRATGTFVGKIGALGVFCVAWPLARTGIAIKVGSANSDALAVAVPAIVDRVCPGALTPTADWPWSIVQNVVGKPVGERVVEEFGSR